MGNLLKKTLFVTLLSWFAVGFSGLGSVEARDVRDELVGGVASSVGESTNRNIQSINESSHSAPVKFLAITGTAVASTGAVVTIAGLFKDKDDGRRQTIVTGLCLLGGGLGLCLIADLVRNAQLRKVSDRVQLGVFPDGNYYAGVRFNF
jgi:stage V sporulation protein SpoVS